MTDGNQLAVLIKSVDLSGIRLAECACRSFPKDVGETTAEINVQLNWSAKAVLRSAEAFSVFADIEALLQPSSGGEADAARIWARFELRYTLRTKTELNEGLLEEFAKMNGIFNAWGYWREFIQSTMLRMELPPLIMPLYRMPSPVSAPAPPKSKAR